MAVHVVDGNDEGVHDVSIADVAHVDHDGEADAGDDDGDDVHEEVKMTFMMLC